MALLGNYSVLNKSLGRNLGGATISDTPANWVEGGAARNRFAGQFGLGFDKTASTPNGYLPPYGWVIAQKSGGMASYNKVAGAGTVTPPNLAAGVNIGASLTGVGTISNAALGLIARAVATLTGSGTIATASLRAIVRGTATLTGSGTLTGSIKAIAKMTAALSGSSATTATIRALGNISAIVSPFTALSPEGLAQSLWNSLAASYNNAGTMGQKVNAAGAASNPWTEALPGAYTSGQAGYILGGLGAGADPWNVALPGAYAAGTAGEKLGNLSTAVSGSAAISTLATAFVQATGSVQSGTLANTLSADGTAHVLTHTGNVIDAYYEFTVGADGVPVGVSALANLNSGNDSLAVYGYNFGSSSWDQVGTLPGTGSAGYLTYDFPLQSSHVSPAGVVRVRFAGGSSNPRFDVDYLYVSYSVVSRSTQIAGVAQAGGATTITLSAAASALDDFYKPALVVLTSGAGAGQSRRVDGYVGATRVATVATPWITQPDNTTTFAVLPWGSVRVSDIDAAPLAGINTEVQSAMTAQGYTTARAPKLDQLDAAISSRAVPGDVASGLTAQGYTGARATKLDYLDAAVSTAGGGLTAPQAATLAQIDSRVDVTLSTRAVPSDVTAGLTTQGYTGARAVKLDQLDVTLSSRAVPGDVQTGLTAQGYTAGRAPNLDNLNATVSSRATPSDVTTAVSGAVTSGLTTQGYTTVRAAFLDNLDAAVSSRSTPAQVATNVQTGLTTQGYTVGRAPLLDNLDATVTSRAAAGQGLTGGQATDLATIATRVDVATSTRATSADLSGGVQAGLTAQGYTTGRAPKIDQLDAAVTTRAVASDVTAGLTTQGYTGARATKLDQLDAAVSSRAVPGDGLTSPQAASLAQIDTRIDVTLSTRATPADFSTSALAKAVWDSLLSSATTAGSLGEALVELHRLAGLDPTKPLIVTSTTRDAGAGLSQTIAEAPVGTVTVTRI